MPDEVCFATKPQLAAVMLHRARDLGVRARWFAGDEVYGRLELRQTARAWASTTALAVKADHTAITAAGRFTAAQLAARVPATSWMRMRTGHGVKGDRHYDWALIEVRPDDTPTSGGPPGTPSSSSAATATPARCPSTAGTAPPPSALPAW